MKRIRYGVQVEFTTDSDVARARARKFVRDALEAWAREWPGLMSDLRIKYVHEATNPNPEAK